jgi:hypothetical protein
MSPGSWPWTATVDWFHWAGSEAPAHVARQRRVMGNGPLRLPASGAHRCSAAGRGWRRTAPLSPGEIRSACPCALSGPSLARALDVAWLCPAKTPFGWLRRADRQSCRSVDPEVSSHRILSARNAKRPLRGALRFWRRGRDSNPRYAIHVRLISSQVHSTALPPLRRGDDEGGLVAGPPS